MAAYFWRITVAMLVLFPFSSTNPLGGLWSGFSSLLMSYYILKYWLFFPLLSLQIHYIFKSQKTCFSSSNSPRKEGVLEKASQYCFRNTLEKTWSRFKQHRFFYFLYSGFNAFNFWKEVGFISVP